MLFRQLPRCARSRMVLSLALAGVLAGAAILRGADTSRTVQPQSGNVTAAAAAEEKKTAPADRPQPAAGKPAETQETDREQAEGTGQPETAEPARRLYRGTVVNLREALKARDIRAEKEFDDQFVLQTTDGRLIPVVPDWRGRAFYQDSRLRNRPVQIVGSQPEGLPWLQVLMVFLVDGHGNRQYMDYWCDICSIPMYQIKPCDCCQAPVRLRFQERSLPEYLSAADRKDPADAQPGQKLPPEEPLPGAEGEAEH